MRKVQSSMAQRTTTLQEVPVLDSILLRIHLPDKGLGRPQDCMRSQANHRRFEAEPYPRWSCSFIYGYCRDLAAIQPRGSGSNVAETWQHHIQGTDHYQRYGRVEIELVPCNCRDLELHLSCSEKSACVHVCMCACVQIHEANSSYPKFMRKIPHISL